MFTDTVTLYNKYMEDGREKWKRTVLGGVHWDAAAGAILRKAGTERTDSVMLIIPWRSGYEKPRMWQENQTGWTLRPGDTVVKGVVEMEIVRSIDRELDVDDKLTITAVDEKKFGGRMAHWEVTGR